MQYKDKLLELLFDSNDESLFDWLAEQPLLEQVDILKELKELLQHMLMEVNDHSQTEALTELGKIIDLYQESILDEQLAALKYEMALEEADKALEKMNSAVDGVRQYVRDCIESNAPNADEMRTLAKQMIANEKKNGVYDPEDWDWFEA